MSREANISTGQEVPRTLIETEFALQSLEETGFCCCYYFLALLIRINPVTALFVTQDKC